MSIFLHPVLPSQRERSQPSIASAAHLCIAAIGNESGGKNACTHAKARPAPFGEQVESFSHQHRARFSRLHLRLLLLCLSLLRVLLQLVGRLLDRLAGGLRPVYVDAMVRGIAKAALYRE